MQIDPKGLEAAKSEGYALGVHEGRVELIVRAYLSALSPAMLVDMSSGRRWMTPALSPAMLVDMSSGRRWMTPALSPAGTASEIEPVAHECATDGCGKPASVHFERGGVGSHYCTDCMSRIDVLRSPDHGQPVAWTDKTGLEFLARGYGIDVSAEAGTMGRSIPLYAHPASQPVPDNGGWLPIELSALSPAGTASEMEPVAWEGYWDGAGSISSETRYTRSIAAMEHWAADGAKITPLYALPPKTEGWQPIETAPKDGTRVDLWQKGRFTDAFWDEGEEWWCIDSLYSDGEPCPLAVSPEPTHWMPLPAPPKAGD